MTTLFTHAALPVLAKVGPRKLLVASVVCACVPDLDVFTYAFGAHAGDWWGHRGISHSFFFAAVIALLGALSFFRSDWKRVFWVLCASGASHGLLDLLTHGDVGVALFAPFTNHRFQVPWVPVSPLGADEFFGKWGALTVFNEVLALLVPIALVLRLRGARLLIASAAWLAVMLLLRTQLPEVMGVRQPRPLLSTAPVGSLEQWRPYFGRDLTPAQTPWSSEFFPYWFGGEGGRWQDNPLTLIKRTLTGVELPMRDEGHRSPTEKYDLMIGDPSFAATRDALSRTHNAAPHPRFWFGLCNGVAAASLSWSEPYRPVTVKSPSGQQITFHPNDVKALLAASYYWTQSMVRVGGECDHPSFDNGRWCSMNPALLVGALVNRLGVERQSFLIDVHPSPQSQYYAVASARVDAPGVPYLSDGTTWLDIEISLQLSSTTLSSWEPDVPQGSDDYQRVGLRAVPVSWKASLAIDAAGEVVGGRWVDDGPDHLMLVSGGPRLTDAGMLEYNPKLEWSRIEALARESSSPPR